MSFFTDEELNDSKNPLADSTAQLDELEKEDTTPSPEQENPVENNDDKIPAKYRGKSIEEIIEMHKNAEAWAQRQAEEVGFARKMAEQAALALRQSEPGSPKATDVDPKDNDVEFFADPANTVKKLVAEHPDVVAAKEAAIEARQRMALETVQKAVGDPAKYLSDPEFLQWAQENPFRINALRHANQNMDPYAAIEIFQTYDLHKGRKQEQQQQQRDQVRDKVNGDKKKAIVDAGSPGEKSSAKIYRRADLIRLQNTDPDRYERLMPEIMRAYAEGRVR
jgi:hypothetical protein